MAEEEDRIIACFVFADDGLLLEVGLEAPALHFASEVQVAPLLLEYYLVSAKRVLLVGLKDDSVAVDELLVQSFDHFVPLR
jgi:hypothetical protein